MKIKELYLEEGKGREEGREQREKFCARIKMLGPEKDAPLFGLFFPFASPCIRLKGRVFRSHFAALTRLPSPCRGPVRRRGKTIFILQQLSLQ